MLDTLRRRFVLSHTVLLFIVIPLVGLAIIYVVETQFLIPNLVREITGQAALIAEQAREHPEIWTDREHARVFLERIDPILDANLTLLDAQGRILASTNSTDANHTGLILVHPDINRVVAGEPSTRTEPSQPFRDEIADVILPVSAPGQKVAGMVRLTHQFATAYEQFYLLRTVIIAILGIALLLGLALGLLLALNVERPLREVTHAAYGLANQQEYKELDETGPREVRWLIRAFNILVERLRKQEESRQKLLANLVHEIGTPLGALNSGLDALSGGAAEEPELRQELLFGMKDEIGYLRRLTNDIALLSGESPASFEIHPISVELETWLPRVLVPWRRAAEAKGLRWEALLSNGLPTIEADPDRLAQVLNNLLSNAIKYTPSGGKVVIRVAVDYQALQIHVSDTGPGIAPDEQARIFEPFYRAHNVSRFSDGMGLGLTIAHDLIEAQGGRLTVSSTLGQGTVSTIWLPISLQSNPPSHSPRSSVDTTLNKT